MEFVRFGRPKSRAEVEDLVDQYIAEHAPRGCTKWRLADSMIGWWGGRVSVGAASAGD